MTKQITKQMTKQITKNKIKETICDICYETKELTLIGKCKHQFCCACIDTWLNNNNTCPMCRKKVQSETHGYFEGDKNLLKLSRLIGI